MRWLQLVESVEIILTPQGAVPAGPGLTREEVERIVDRRVNELAVAEKKAGDTPKEPPKPEDLASLPGSAGGIAGSALNPLEAARGGLLRLVPGIGAAVSVVAIVRQVIDEFFKPGGAWDRRLDLRIEDQVAALQARQALIDLRSRRRVLHTVAAAGLRGREGTIYSSASERSVVDLNEAVARGLK